MNGTPPRVVLDTNVLLDLFVFDDPRCAQLAQALRAGAIEAVTCAACEAEWRAVLDYPQLALEPERRTRGMAAFDALVRRLPSPSASDLPRLPRCADPDDQKFLALAASAGARWLVSRDRALLVLHRRCLREFGLAIVPPQPWLAPALPQDGRLDGQTQGPSAKPV